MPGRPPSCPKSLGGFLMTHIKWPSVMWHMRFSFSNNTDALIKELNHVNRQYLKRDCKSHAPFFWEILKCPPIAGHGSCRRWDWRLFKCTYFYALYFNGVLCVCPHLSLIFYSLSYFMLCWSSYKFIRCLKSCLVFWYGIM